MCLFEKSRLTQLMKNRWLGIGGLFQCGWNTQIVSFNLNTCQNGIKNIFFKKKTSDTKQKYEVQTIEVPFNHRSVWLCYR